MPIIRFTGLAEQDGSSAGLPILMRNRRLLTQFEAADGYLYVAHGTDLLEFDARGIRYEELGEDELERVLPEDYWRTYEAFRSARPDILDSDVDLPPRSYDAAHFFVDAPLRSEAERRIAAYDREELRWRGLAIQGLLWRPGGVIPNLNGSWRRAYPPEAGWTGYAAVPSAHAVGFCQMLGRAKLSGHDADHIIAIGERFAAPG